MSILLILLLPVLGALLIFTLGRTVRRSALLLLLTAAGHLLLTVGSWFLPFPDFGWFGADLPGKIVLSIASLLFFCVSIHLQFWLPAAMKFEGGTDGEKMMPPHLFCALLPLFLETMTLTALSRNFGMLWVSVEATTLASAPLILFHRSAGSLEAMWKYLLLCSVGIGLALFGTMLFGVAAGANSPEMDFGELELLKENFNPVWFKAAFIFCFAGYGLKMGLAPFHTWLPDAHSEAPATVSALLSGSLLNCAFLGILRISEIAPETLAHFIKNTFLTFGMLSLVIGSFFILRQNDYKRMLAYSSVEHMGLAILLWGCALPQAAMLHVISHSLCKMMLFLIAGNILMATGTRQIPLVRGLYDRMPRTALLWICGMLLICGTPPSPLFLTEFLLVQEIGPWLGGTVLLLLFLIFCGMSANVLKMCMGDGRENPLTPPERAAEKMFFIPVLAAAALLIGGSWLLLNFIDCFGA